MPTNLINLCIKRHNEFLIVPQLVEKAIFDFYASCGSTHSIEFALQIHKFREHVSRNLYKGRKNVSVGRGFSSRFARKRGFEREAVRKTKFFDSLIPRTCGSGCFWIGFNFKRKRSTTVLIFHSQFSILNFIFTPNKSKTPVFR